MGIPSQAEYERREAAEFANQRQRVERDWRAAPRHDRQEEEKKWFEALSTQPDLVAERVSWLIDGIYGYGAHKQAREVVRNSRMNREAWLVQTVGTLEWMVPGDVTRKLWHKLTSAQQARLNKMIGQVIREAKEEG